LLVTNQRSGNVVLDSVGPEVLDTEECLRLMATAPIGRVVFTDQALPAVLPVHFLLRDRTIVVRTDHSSKLSAAVRNSVVAFEVDEFDVETGTGWSVTATGHARLVRDGMELAELLALGLRPWTPGGSQQFVLISIEILNGRRI
jgi:uncharacterized protein